MPPSDVLSSAEAICVIPAGPSRFGGVRVALPLPSGSSCVWAHLMLPARPPAVLSLVGARLLTPARVLPAGEAVSPSAPDAVAPFVRPLLAVVSPCSAGAPRQLTPSPRTRVTPPAIHLPSPFASIRAVATRRSPWPPSRTSIFSNTSPSSSSERDALSIRSLVALYSDAPLSARFWSRAQTASLFRRSRPDNFRRLRAPPNCPPASSDAPNWCSASLLRRFAPPLSFCQDPCAPLRFLGEPDCPSPFRMA